MDADGNELGGIRMPEIAVPLASYTGWDLRSPAIGAPSEPLPFLGSWIPFAETKTERLAAGDTRLSVAERYVGEQDYLSRVNSAARELAKEGFLLEPDLEFIQRRAAEEWEYRQGLR